MTTCSHRATGLELRGLPLMLPGTFWSVGLRTIPPGDTGLCGSLRFNELELCPMNAIHTFILFVLATAAFGQTQYAFTNFAGLPGGAGNVDGTGSAARFRFPSGVAADRAGNVYVADKSNNTIRKIRLDGVVTTLAGSAGQIGSTDGTGSAATFGGPWGVAVDGGGTVEVADLNNHTIWKITPAGEVTTLAGSSGKSGSADGTGSAALFHVPTAVAADSTGNLYVADSANFTVRKLTPAGEVTTFAGSAGERGGADGTG